MTSSTVQELLQTSLGQLLASAELAELVRTATERSVGRGSYLFRAGDTGSALFVVIDGQLEVVVGQAGGTASVVAHLGPGQLIGEIELLTRCPRVASVVASEASHVLEISASHLDTLLRENHPLAAKLMQAIARLLARRLSAVNQRLLRRTQNQLDDFALPSDAISQPISEADLDVLDRLWS